MFRIALLSRFPSLVIASLQSSVAILSRSMLRYQLHCCASFLFPALRPVLHFLPCFRMTCLLRKTFAYRCYDRFSCCLRVRSAVTNGRHTLLVVCCVLHSLLADVTIGLLFLARLFRCYERLDDTRCSLHRFSADASLLFLCFRTTCLLQKTPSPTSRCSLPALHSDGSPDPSTVAMSPCGLSRPTSSE